MVPDAAFRPYPAPGPATPPTGPDSAFMIDNDVNIEMISTSTIRISVVVEKSKLNTAVKALHSAFDLDSGVDYSAPLPERK